MIESELETTPTLSEAVSVVPGGNSISGDCLAEPGLTVRDRWEVRRSLAMHRAETERLRVLIDFLARPVHAPGGTEPDPDIVTAYNLAVEAALVGIRRASFSSS